MPENHPFHTRKNDTGLIPVDQAKRVIRVEDRGVKRRKKKKRRKRSIKTVGYIFCALPILLLISAAAAFLLFQLNLAKIQKMADLAVPELRANLDGTYELSWPGLKDAEADFYFVDVGTAEMFSENGKRTFFSGYVGDVSCILPELPMDEGLVLEMELIKKYYVLGKEHTLKVASTQRYFYLRNSKIKKVDWEVDPDAGIAYINMDILGANGCSIYVTEPNGEKKFLKNVDKDILELNLNEEDGLWIPTPGNPCVLTIVPGNLVNGMALYGGEARELSFTWEEFAARDIHLALEVKDGCVAYLEWDKVDCNYYEIQMMDKDADVWKSVKTVTRKDECTYVSPRLTPGAGYSFRVAAVLDDYAAVSEVRECEIEVTPLYCTIWPVKNLRAYSDAAKSAEVGEAKNMEAYCVVDVQDNMFGISLNDSVCYIDSNYCLINLPEYLGSLCNYNITNSYASIFMAHDFVIPGLTDEVIKGYQNVHLQDNSFLVPLLYPTARKLETAVEGARESGYRLKIYDAFRPHEASVFMYQTAQTIEYETLPELTYYGEQGVDPFVSTQDENGMWVMKRKTYHELMIGNTTFVMGSFLNAGISRHNYGVALDLTIEYLESGDELRMQTAMHDLSHYSARVQNNDSAKQLSQIMTTKGFNTISSEWWHFQDDDSVNKFSLPYVEQGASGECWMYNGVEWTYRYADGTYAAN